MTDWFTEANDCVSGTIIPRNDNVLVRIEPLPARADQIIIRPDLGPNEIEGVWARVVAIGNKSYARQCEHCGRPYDEYDPAEITVGDRVLLNSKHSGNIVLNDGREHRLVRVAEIIAVVEE